MRCDRCGQLRQYFKPAIVVVDGVARSGIEKTPPRNDDAVRFHPDCYAAARIDDPSLPQEILNPPIV